MLFAVDVGNTNVVAGVFDGQHLVTRWRIHTESRRMPDEYIVLFRSLFAAANLDVADVHGIAVCGVVPSAQSMLLESLQRLWPVNPVIVSGAIDLGLEVRYSPRLGVGADRLANAVAAIHRYGAPAIVVDFGTGTNFDAVSRDGAYVGGAIAPGLEISEEALFAHTAQLPRVPLVPPPAAVGTNTIEALQSGIVYGYAGLVDGLVDRMRAELGNDAVVVGTGGLADVVAPCTRTIQHVDIDLTLQGLRLLYERNT